MFALDALPAALALSALTLLAPSVEAQCFDWQSFHGPGLDGTGLCSEVFAGQLYVGGEFTHAGNLPVSNIARWNGVGWAPVDLGLYGPTDPDVRDLALFDDGSGTALYAGGNFSRAGSTLAYGVARWDGTRWSSVTPSGSSSSFGLVETLIGHDDGTGPALYAAGDSSNQTTPRGHVSRLNGLAWELLDGYMDGAVHDLIEFGGELYAGGSFLQTGGAINAPGVARWNGTSWEAVGAGLTPSSLFGQEIGVLEFEAHDAGAGLELYAGGLFEDASGTTYDLARWDGSQWSMLRPSNDRATALRSFDDGNGPLLMIGARSGSGLWSYDGNSFAAVPVSPSGYARVEALAAFDATGAGAELHAIGVFQDVLTTTSSTRAGNVARWDGADWHALGNAASDLEDGRGVEAYELFDDGTGIALYMAGEFSRAGDLHLGNVAKLSGDQIEALGTGTDDVVYALAAHDDGSGHALYAGGKFKTAGGVPALNVARWDGAQWSAIGGGVANKVRTMISHDDGSGPALYAAGGQLPVSRWDGTAWTPVGTNPPFGWSMLVHDDGSGPKLFVGDGNNLMNTVGDVWRWDGQAWTSVGPSNSRINALASFDDGSGPALYAGGAFTAIGGTGLDSIARWDGSTWSAVGTHPFQSRVLSLAVYDDGSGPRLAAYAGNDLEMWDGAAWSATPQTWPYPRGVDMQALGNDLHVAGTGSRILVWWGPAFDCPWKVTCGGQSSICASQILVSGTPSGSLAADFQILTGISGGTQGMYFFGTNGPNSKPWGPASTLCVKPPFQRLPVLTSGGTPGSCDGVLDFELNQWLRANPHKAPQPGDAVWLQGWYLDPAATVGSSLTPMIEFYVWP